MANSKILKPRRAQATINEAPGAEGYWTDPINANTKRASDMFFGIRETGDSSTFSATITLQWRQKSAEDDTWEDWQGYGTYTSVERKIIDDHSAHVQYRIGVKNGDYVDGEVTVGINW